jgi:hypothetical protein
MLGVFSSDENSCCPISWKYCLVMFLKAFNKVLWTIYAYLRHLESYYCILRWIKCIGEVIFIVKKKIFRQWKIWKSGIVLQKIPINLIYALSPRWLFLINLPFAKLHNGHRLALSVRFLINLPFAKLHNGHRLAFVRAHILQTHLVQCSIQFILFMWIYI